MKAFNKISIFILYIIILNIKYIDKENYNNRCLEESEKDEEFNSNAYIHFNPELFPNLSTLGYFMEIPDNETSLPCSPKEPLFKQVHYEENTEQSEYSFMNNSEDPKIETCSLKNIPSPVFNEGFVTSSTTKDMLTHDKINEEVEEGKEEKEKKKTDSMNFEEEYTDYKDNREFILDNEIILKTFSTIWKHIKLSYFYDVLLEIMSNISRKKMIHKPSVYINTLIIDNNREKQKKLFYKKRSFIKNRLHILFNYKIKHYGSFFLLLFPISDERVGTLYNKFIPFIYTDKCYLHQMQYNISNSMTVKSKGKESKKGEVDWCELFNNIRISRDQLKYMCMFLQKCLREAKYGIKRNMKHKKLEYFIYIILQKLKDENKYSTAFVMEEEISKSIDESMKFCRTKLIKNKINQFQVRLDDLLESLIYDRDKRNILTFFMIYLKFKLLYTIINDIKNIHRDIYLEFKKTYNAENINDIQLYVTENLSKINKLYNELGYLLINYELATKINTNFKRIIDFQSILERDLIMLRNSLSKIENNYNYSRVNKTIEFYNDQVEHSNSLMQNIYEKIHESLLNLKTVIVTENKYTK